MGYHLPDDYYHPCTKKGMFIKYEWMTDKQTIYAVKIKSSSMNNIVQNLAQGEWISMQNIANTQALMKPQSNNDTEYSMESYTAEQYIISNNLNEDYSQWKNSYEQSSELTQEQLQLVYLVQNKLYPKYIWWSRKGAGIYRYVGYDILKDYEWKSEQT